MSDSMIPLSRQHIDDEVKKASLDALDSGVYILGERSRTFEEEFAKYIGTKHGILANSATSSLFLGLKSLGLEKGEIIVPSHTAFPGIEPVLHAGHTPVFVDIDPETYTMDPRKIEEKITDKTRAIIPVHLYGHSADMDPIIDIAKGNDLIVIEDCAQAHGAEYKGKRVGSFGMFSIFSFYPSKNLSVCGDGGIVVTNNDDLAQKMRMLRNHGRKGKYEHEIVGYNMRFNEIQAAIGLVRLRKLDQSNERRRAIAQMYRNRLTNVKLPVEKEWTKHVHHMFVVQVKQRENMMSFLKERGIATGIHYPIPCHLQPAILNTMTKIHLEKTESVVNTILSLPMSPYMTDDDVERVCSTINEFV